MIPAEAVEAAAAEIERRMFGPVKLGELTRAALEAAAPFMLADRAKLVEALYQGYKILGFDTDGCDTGECMLAHSGLGGDNLDSYINMIAAAFREARRQMDEA